MIDTPKTHQSQDARSKTPPKTTPRTFARAPEAPKTEMATSRSSGGKLTTMRRRAAGIYANATKQMVRFFAILEAVQRDARRIAHRERRADALQASHRDKNVLLVDEADPEREGAEPGEPDREGPLGTEHVGESSAGQQEGRERQGLCNAKEQRVSIPSPICPPHLTELETAVIKLT